jgi:hypothetical protein
MRGSRGIPWASCFFVRRPLVRRRRRWGHTARRGRLPSFLRRSSRFRGRTRSGRHPRARTSMGMGGALHARTSCTGAASRGQLVDQVARAWVVGEKGSAACRCAFGAGFLEKGARSSDLVFFAVVGGLPQGDAQHALATRAKAMDVRDHGSRSVRHARCRRTKSLVSQGAPDERRWIVRYRRRRCLRDSAASGPTTVSPTVSSWLKSDVRTRTCGSSEATRGRAEGSSVKTRGRAPRSSRTSP